MLRRMHVCQRGSCTQARRAASGCGAVHQCDGVRVVSQSACNTRGVRGGGPTSYGASCSRLPDAGSQRQSLQCHAQHIPLLPYVPYMRPFSQHYQEGEGAQTAHATGLVWSRGGCSNNCSECTGRARPSRRQVQWCGCARGGCVLRVVRSYTLTRHACRSSSLIIGRVGGSVRYGYSCYTVHYTAWRRCRRPLTGALGTS